MSVNLREGETVEIIKNRLYWTCSQEKPLGNVHCFCTDREFRYFPYCNDFGPLDISQTYKYCKRLEGILDLQELKDKRIFHCTSPHPHKAANSAFLIGAFSIIVLKMRAEDAIKHFEWLNAKFRDASDGPCDYFCSLSDCFIGLEQAIRRNWFNYSTFSLKDYDFFSKPENGDLNWIIPNQFAAFSSPSNCETFIKSQNLPVEKLCPVLKSLKINTVIRLNKPCYDASKLNDKGITLYELFFEDGSVPSIEIVDKFIDICNDERGAIGVHCKAGLGRTGTLIACYAIKIFKFPAAGFIAWCRLCRPGSVLGPQQQFLIDYEEAVRKRKAFSLTSNQLNCCKAIFGEHNQGERLMEAKNKRMSMDIGIKEDIHPEIFQLNLKKGEGNVGKCAEKKVNIEILAESGKNSHISEGKLSTPPPKRDVEATSTTPLKKPSRFESEMQRLCMKNSLKHGSNSTFYALACKNLRSDRIFKILYGNPSPN